MELGLPGFIKNFFTGGGSAFVSAVSGLVDKIEAPAEQKRKLEADLKQAYLNADTEEKREALEKLNTYLADVQNARGMQIEALKQSDLFSKRFLYVFASIVTLLTFAYDFLMLKYSVPAENKDLCNIVCGGLNSMCLASIITFFFGGSKGSDDKNKMIDNLINKV